MTSVSEELRRYARAPLWAYQPLGRWAKRGVVIFAGVTIILDSLLRATSSESVSIASAAVSTGTSLAVALFAWRPPVGALVLICIAILGGATGITDTLVAGIAPIGLVAFSCSAPLTIGYLLAWIGWVVVAQLRPGSGIEPLGAIVAAVIGLTSLIIGAAIRQQTTKANTLARQLEATEREVAEQLRHERDLIADELHDIVAHEITIVALHAAVLERSSDEGTRTQSQTAIREAAVQALTDIRRVLGMVRGEENLSPERVPSADNLRGTIVTVKKELEQAGIQVTVDVPDEVRLPSASLVALIRVIRESGTNVLKHATGARHVRIALTIERGWANLEFTDDSPPARTAGLPASGYGIMRLRERFRLFGGTFDASRGASGWTVTASLPLTS